MNKFNLTFSGEIIAGHDPAEVRSRFGKWYSIDDPARLERFFSGETIILRRNMERKEAARCYHELHMLGVVAKLVKVTTSDTVNELVNDKQNGQVYARPTAKKSAVTKSPVTQATAKPRSPAKNARVPAARSNRTQGKATRPTSANVAQHTPLPKQRDSVDIAAALKARKLESQRAAAAQAAQQEAALAEHQRQQRQEATRLAAEAAAQRAAQEAEERRLAAEEEARRAAALAAARQREAEEAVRKAEEAARKAEEEARKAAEEAAARQRKADEAARKAAEEAAIKQRKAEEAARIKAAKAEARRKAAEAEAQRKAQRKQEKEERARQKAEAEALRKAELEAQRRQAEEEARRKAEQAELARREAEEDARLRAELAAIKQREEDEAARLQAELDAKAREAAAQAERIKQEAQQRQAEAQRNSAARRRAAAKALAERQAQRDKQAPASTARAAVPGSSAADLPRREREQSHSSSAPAASPATPAKSRSNAAPEIPQRTTTPIGATAAIAPRKRQPGEPNLYQLRPFRANEEVRSRAARAKRLRRRSYTVGFIALAALLLALGNFLQRTTETAITGARAAATAPREGPVLLVGDTLLFHDRAGNGTTTAALSTLQLAALEAPLAYDSDGVLYARGRLSGGEPGDTSLQLLRCDAPLSTCREFSAELKQHSIDAFVLNAVDGSVLVADAQAGLLLKADRDGKVLASAAITLPAQPVLQLHGGLLLINSATAPALSILRYEDKAFGQQLDEILLLPPSVTAAEQLRVGNFLWSGDAWWASLRNSETGAERLYRFDDEWNFLNEVTLPHSGDSLQLTAWGTKTLVSDAQHVAMERFNAQGVAEAPFVSSTLDTLKTAQQRRIGLAGTAWHSGLLLCAIIALLGLGLGYLNTLRALVYNTRRESGAEPIDGYADTLQWINPDAQRLSALRRRTVSYGLLAIGVMLVAIKLSVTATQLAALLVALSGPLLALLWLARKPIGHLGVMDERLALVDHNGMYHIAGGSRVQHCGPFLCIDDVLVCSGTRLFPAFSAAQVQQQVKPLLRAGIKVDYRTVLVKLIESRHPLAVGVLAILGAVAAALLLLSLQGLH